MRKTVAMLIALLFVLPGVLAYENYGSSDYSYNKDFEYVRYHETEDARRNYNDCGYYDYDYYGSSCRGSRDAYSYHRSRDFEFGRYHEDVHASSDYGRGYYDYNRDSFSYPGYRSYTPYGYDEGYDYNGGYGMGAHVYGYLPYDY